MGFGRPHSARSTLSEINVTPLVDVMLVLLIIFMVSAPLLQQGIDVKLPKVSADNLSIDDQNHWTVSISAKGDLRLNQEKIEGPELIKKLQKKRNPQVFIQADKDAPYGVVASVMGKLRQAKINRIGLVTEPEQ